MTRDRDPRNPPSAAPPPAHGLATSDGYGEACGLDRTLKANTVKRRTMSLFNQGSYWYRRIPNMGD
ncbi:MAG: hypothetical protein KF819_40375, partial [Labilithrix sp.]|nr:hypothetical protein [Labilithrix sp.]